MFLVKKTTKSKVFSYEVSRANLFLISYLYILYSCPVLKSRFFNKYLQNNGGGGKIE